MTGVAFFIIVPVKEWDKHSMEIVNCTYGRLNIVRHSYHQGHIEPPKAADVPLLPLSHWCPQMKSVIQTVCVAAFPTRHSHVVSNPQTSASDISLLWYGRQNSFVIAHCYMSQYQSSTSTPLKLTAGYLTLRIRKCVWATYVWEMVV